MPPRFVMQDLGQYLKHALFSTTDWFRANPDAALLIAVGLYLVLFVLLLVLWIRTQRLLKRQRLLLSGTNGENIEQMLLAQVGSTDTIQRQIADAMVGSEQNAARQKYTLQKIGLIRFDAFPDVGGEQSFALALLDDSNTGIVLSGLHSRNDMRVYAKPVTNGTSPVNLSDEERRAVASAQSSETAIPIETKGVFRPRRAQSQG